MFEKLLHEVVPILGLLAVILLVLRRLPKVDLGHVAGFTRRRALNWLPLGLTYAFLYMGRYNINVAQVHGVMTKEQVGTVAAVGSIVYGAAFVLNGPITDRIGGRKTIMLSAGGAAVCNLIMAYLVWTHAGYAGNGALTSHGVLLFSLAYAANMYFQSFGAVSIVKVNAQWFHVLERGVLGGVFGILISLGVYFAYDWSRIIGETVSMGWMFAIPAIILLVFVVIDYKLVFDNPSDTGYPDFDVGDASSEDGDVKLTVWQVAKRMVTNPIIVTIAFIELCSGFTRNGITHWAFTFLSNQGNSTFAYENWGMMSCIAGILGGMFAGTISDKVFDSRRGPSVVFLYAMLIVAVALGAVFIASPLMAYMLIFGFLCVIGVHGMLSGTASADFGGKKNAGLAVGLIDGMVYLGSAAQEFIFGHVLPSGEAAKDPTHWRIWLLIIIPVCVVGFVLAMRIWNAVPRAARAASERLAQGKGIAGAAES